MATAPGEIRAGRLLQSGLAACALDLQRLLPSERKQCPAWPHRGCRRLPLSSWFHFSSIPHIYLGFLKNREDNPCNSELAAGGVLPRRGSCASGLWQITADSYPINFFHKTNGLQCLAFFVSMLCTG